MKNIMRETDVVLAAVRSDGMLLEDVPRIFRRERGVVLAAVNNNGRALEYVPEFLREDSQVVLAAVENDGLALQYASETLQNDKDMLLAAVKNDPTGIVLAWASEKLWTKEVPPEYDERDTEIVREAFRKIKGEWGVLEQRHVPLQLQNLVEQDILDDVAFVTRCRDSLKARGVSRFIENPFLGFVEIGLGPMAIGPVRGNAMAWKMLDRFFEGPWRKLVLEAVRKDHSLFEYVSSSFKSTRAFCVV